MTIEELRAQLMSEKPQIEAARAMEQEARDILSNVLRPHLEALFPRSPSTFVAANGKFANELTRGAGEIADAVSAASINWDGPSQDQVIKKVFTSSLVRLLAMDALVSGKMALYPCINELGALEFAVPTGYLHPVLSPDNALRALEVIQILGVRVGDRDLWKVHRYAPGMLEVYPPASDWLKSLDGIPAVHEQQGIGLPLAFATVRRDANRLPYGLVAECVPAFLRFAKTAINRNAVQEIAGFPERVVKSDEYLRLALEGDPRNRGLEAQAITALKTVAPRQLKIIGTGDSYEVQNGVDPTPHLAAEAIDRQALLDLLRAPDLSGGNVSEVAIAERQIKYRSLVIGLCDHIAELVTEAMALASELPGGPPAGLTATLKPKFPGEFQKRIDQTLAFYEKDLIPKWVALLELQTLGVESISDDLIEQAKAQYLATLSPPTTPPPSPPDTQPSDSAIQASPNDDLLSA